MQGQGMVGSLDSFSDQSEKFECLLDRAERLRDLAVSHYSVTAGVRRRSPHSMVLGPA